MKRFSYCHIFLFVLVALFGCSNDDTDYGVKWNDDAMAYIRNGIDVPYDKSNYSLDFSAARDAEISVSSNAEWIETEIATYDEQRQLRIAVDINRDATPRTAVVCLQADGRQTSIEIRQKEAPRAITDRQQYTLPAEGGDFTIKVKATGKLTAELSPIEGDWAKIKGITQDKKTGDYQITLSADMNEGLGRITALWFQVDGKRPIQDLGPCIVQEPAPFAESVTVRAKDAGMLEVLLGNDADNLRKIRNLTIAARLNARDLNVLKRLFLSTSGCTENYPVNLDLSNCGIYAGDENPFEYYGYTPKYMELPKIYFYGELPERAFADAANLTGIKLPGDMTIIGRSAFAGCTALKEVTIPITVEEIQGRAFYNCTEMEQITISPLSNLKALGAMALATRSKLKSIYLPASLEKMEVEALLGLKASEIHLRWNEPPIVKVIPNTEDCILFVPNGTLETYKATNNWNRFSNIVEEPIEEL